MSATALDILRDARTLYAFAPSHASTYPTVGTHCPITAMATVGVRADGPADEAVDEAVEAFRDASGAGPAGIPRWNVKHSTAEVLAAFDRAIGASS